ncbi:hypothetical protein BofuT4_P002450.1 [Botrytis cinerea T4]|uniref:Glucose-methanol-choline oxidoreductase N-terminal domain-containing protein n=1 Tax=Botryotinia fuckeliana (strain T4) TaxID=999810 RepID=G2YMF0_BOTF4|nr:hypothetical protein BofuT4_P002450.1 [Botrytis cinerea T4]
MGISKIYDFIIVGGGTSGLVVATRLSENPDIQVLVLEAGGNHLENPQSELGNRTLDLPGRCLPGGSSVINAQAFIAASKIGLDAWKEFGNEGWDCDSMKPHYKKCQTVEIPNDRLRKELYEMSENAFTGSSIGGFVNNSTVNGVAKERSYAANAYFKPAQNRSDIHLVTNSLVEKIILNKESGEAVAKGVKVTIKGVEHIFQAGKEVIVAARALNSPRILELSGIGEAELLRSLGVDIYVENSSVVDEIQTLDSLKLQEPEAIAAAMSAYQTEKAGPFASEAISSLAYMPVPDFQTPKGKDALAILIIHICVPCK